MLFHIVFAVETVLPLCAWQEVARILTPPQLSFYRSFSLSPASAAQLEFFTNHHLVLVSEAILQALKDATDVSQIPEILGRLSTKDADFLREQARFYTQTRYAHAETACATKPPVKGCFTVRALRVELANENRQ